MAIKNNYGTLLRREYKKDSEVSLNHTDNNGVEMVDMLFSDEELEDECILKTQLVELKETWGVINQGGKEFHYIYLYDEPWGNKGILR